MGQAIRTTKLPLNLAPRDQGGATTGKRLALDETVRLLTAARTFYVDFFLVHAGKLSEQVRVISPTTGVVEERLISADKLLTWAEARTVQTRAHPTPLPTWNFSERFPEFPFLYRRPVIKDAVGKVRGYLSTLSAWQASGRKKGQPGLPGASNHPTLYDGGFRLDLESRDQQSRFVQLKVFTGQAWTWANYPVKASRYFAQRLAEPGWEVQSPKVRYPLAKARGV